MTRFCRYELRTTDLTAARAFYARVLGRAGIDAVPLPADAAARGAPPHWLGHLGVEDVEGTARAFVDRGATRLGPTRPGAAGGEVAIVRDPGGAVVALATAPAAPRPGDGVWHVLHAADFARAAASYTDLFSWQLTDRLDLGPLGVYRHFAWSPGGANVGAVTDISARPGVHPHWLFHFAVSAIDGAVAAVREHGGEVIAQVATPDRARIAVCHDPQGAIFALREPAV
jgi:predicted enzyme related to lactoylglutathione lyase